MLIWGPGRAHLSIEHFAGDGQREWQEVAPSDDLVGLRWAGRVVRQASGHEQHMHGLLLGWRPDLHHVRAGQDVPHPRRDQDLRAGRAVDDVERGFDFGRPLKTPQTKIRTLETLAEFMK